MALFDSLKKKQNKTTEEIMKNEEDNERENVKIGTGVAINESVRESSVTAAVKYKRAEYNPQTRKAIYDDGNARHAAMDRAFADGNEVRDPYTGQILVKTQREAKARFGESWQQHVGESDHIDTLGQLIKRNEKKAFLTEADLKEIGRADDNFQIISRKLNQTSKTVGKGGSTQQEWADDEVRMKGVAEEIESGEPIDTVRKRIRDTGREAEKRNDRRAFKKGIENAVDTAHEAGLSGAKSAVEMAGAMSGIMNIVSVIKGEKSVEDAISDTASDVGMAALTGYTISSGMTVLSHSMSYSSSSFIQALAKNNVPTKIITAVMVTGDTLKKWGNGEITTQECLAQLGDKGLNMVTMGYSMAVGQTLIPIPVIGSAVGALVGTMLMGSLYNSLMVDLHNKQLQHEERMRIITECRAAVEQERKFREELEVALATYFSDYKTCFNDALSSMKVAYQLGDADGVIASANDITRKLGGTVQYENMEEFEEFLESDSVYIL